MICRLSLATLARIAHKSAHKSANMAQIKVKLPTFNALEGADDFLHKFDLLIIQNKWETKDADIINHFAYCMTGAALTWWRQVSRNPDSIDTWDKVRKLFNARWINNDPAFLLEQRLEARKLVPGESLEAYYGDILELCQKVGRSELQMAIKFVNGLPPRMHDYCCAGDNQSMQNILNRAKRFLALNPRKSEGPGSHNLASGGMHV